MPKLAILINSRTQPGKRPEVFAAYRQHMAPRAEENEAQEVVVWCDDATDPDSFFLFEIYANEADFQANAQAPWFAEYMAAVGPLLAEEPSVTMASPTWATGLDG